MVLDIVLWVGFGLAVAVLAAVVAAAVIVLVGITASAFAAAAVDREEMREDHEDAAAGRERR
jgi:hypothetical protein